jgi:glycosyltransferase involved in cell wall biosynthesis
MVATVEAAPRPADAGPREGVLYVGRLIRQKGVDDLLRAAVALDPPVPLEIAGDGPERPRLERLARSLAVPARFHGFVDPTTRDRLYARAAVVCVPSRPLASGLSEGAPLVICEARAHGLPVVASAVGGIPELCADDPGATLVPHSDPAALAQALQRALTADAPAQPRAG